MVRYPEVFWLFLLLIPLMVLFFWWFRRGSTAVRRLGGLWRHRSFYDIYVVKWFFSTLGFILFFTGAVLALAGFPGAVKKEPFIATGWDTVFVVDISRSMLAQDELPSRMDRARGLVRTLTDSLDSGRFGLVVFRGAGSRLFPLSEDRNGLASALEAVSPDLMSAPGTNLADGLSAAMDSFVAGGETSRRIILLTDGEEWSGDAGDAAKRIREERVKLTVIGLGTPAGAYIPLPDGSRLKDGYGREVLTRMNEHSLRRLAEQAGGTYLRGDNPELLSLILEDFSSETLNQGGGFLYVETERFRIFVLMALLGLLIHKGVKAGRWKNDF